MLMRCVDNEQVYFPHGQQNQHAARVENMTI